MPEYTVTSEIYDEYNYQTKITPSKQGNVISEFPFLLPITDSSVKYDDDEDLDVDRPIKQVVRIEHSSKTKISLVGLQVWRGAFLLGDWLIHLGLKGELAGKNVLELGAGTGVTSFVAAMYAKKVVCTDSPNCSSCGVPEDVYHLLVECVRTESMRAYMLDEYHLNPVDIGAFQCILAEPLCDIAKYLYSIIYNIYIDLGGILELIKLNARYNKKFIKSDFKVMPLNFTDTAWSSHLTSVVRDVDIIICADVIYDDDVTAAFVSTIQKILNTKPPKTLYIVLEKRYVFTIEHLDAVAPCYETFLTLLDKVKTDNVHSTWTVELLPLDFPKYFTYDRVKDLVLWKISSKPT